MVNKRKPKRLTLLVLTVLLIIPSRLLMAKNNDEPPAEPIMPMIRAMGGAFTAVANDENAVFVNPAGYAVIKDGIITAFSLGIKVNIDESTMQLYDAMISGANITSSTNINSFMKNTTLAPAVAGPIRLGRVGNNFGFSLYTNLSATIDTSPGGFIPSATLESCNDIGFVGGYGFQFPFVDRLYLGFNLKVILRVASRHEGTLLSVMDAMSDTSELPVSKAIGFGGDIGVIYFPLEWLSVGISAKDFFRTHFKGWDSLNGTEAPPDSFIKPRLAFGTAFYPLKSEKESKYFNSFVIALDYSDLLDYSSVFSNIKFGTSFKTLKIINLRFGVEGGYPAGGIGFDLRFFQFSTAYFVDELGAFPGANPVQNIMFNFAFTW
jgi:hypothetical protein